MSGGVSPPAAFQGRLVPARGPVAGTAYRPRSIRGRLVPMQHGSIIIE